MDARPCPFCGTTARGELCGACNRDITAARRVCTKCQKMTPVSERVCYHCGSKEGSELAWKVPVIIIMFIVAFLLSIAIALIR